MRSDTPKLATITIDNPLKKSAEMPLTRTIVERNNVKNVKLRTKPATTPNGRDLLDSFPPIVEVRIIGNIGRIQGERIVTTPAKKANPNSKAIDLFI